MKLKNIKEFENKKNAKFGAIKKFFVVRKYKNAVYFEIDERINFIYAFRTLPLQKQNEVYNNICYLNKELKKYNSKQPLPSVIVDKNIENIEILMSSLKNTMKKSQSTENSQNL